MEQIPNLGFNEEQTSLGKPTKRAINFNCDGQKPILKDVDTPLPKNKSDASWTLKSQDSQRTKLLVVTEVKYKNIHQQSRLFQQLNLRVCYQKFARR